MSKMTCVTVALGAGAGAGAGAACPSPESTDAIGAREIWGISVGCESRLTGARARESFFWGTCS
jgi:hypothetical protein